MCDGNEKRIESKQFEDENKYELNFKSNKLRSDNKSNTKSSSTNSTLKSSSIKSKEIDENDKIINDFKSFSLEPSLDSQNKFDDEFERKLKEKSRRFKDMNENDEPYAKRNNFNNARPQSSVVTKRPIVSDKTLSNGSLNKGNSLASNYQDTSTSNQDYTTRPIDIETALVNF